MYERFNDEVRAAMHSANEFARVYNHEYIGVEHALLALVNAKQSEAYRVLRIMGIPAEIVGKHVTGLLQRGPDMLVQGKRPQTPRMKRVIEYTMDEARNLQHSHIGTEHLLLGLIREPEGIAGQELRKNGATLENARQVIAAPKAQIAAKPVEPGAVTRDTMGEGPWGGIGKLMEECGEVVQLCGKALVFPAGEHPDGKGPLCDRLPFELADLKAAIRYFEETNGLPVLAERTEAKLKQFRAWGLSGREKSP